MQFDFHFSTSRTPYIGHGFSKCRCSLYARPNGLIFVVFSWHSGGGFSLTSKFTNQRPGIQILKPTSGTCTCWDAYQSTNNHMRYRLGFLDMPFSYTDYWIDQVVNPGVVKSVPDRARDISPVPVAAPRQHINSVYMEHRHGIDWIWDCVTLYYRHHSRHNFFPSVRSTLR